MTYQINAMGEPPLSALSCASRKRWGQAMIDMKAQAVRKHLMLSVDSRVVADGALAFFQRQQITDIRGRHQCARAAVRSHQCR